MIYKTLKEALIKSLEDLQSGTATEVYKNIEQKQYYIFHGKTPEATVQAQLGELIRGGDTRIKRAKNSNNVYCYYLTRNEDTVESTSLFTDIKVNKKDQISYMERDLHPLLCTFLKDRNIYTKTIFHEQSKRTEQYQKWIHPDIIGVKFIEYNDETCQQLFKFTNLSKAVDIYSYELKREINTDYELKQYFFQAVSNSSWANYGYLVAFEIGDNLLDELERLNESFGIGVIQLNANAYKSKVLIPSKRREVDFKTMNKLCNANTDFQTFFAQVEKVLTADSRFVNDIKQALENLCDIPFDKEEEIEDYCKEKHIPFENKKK